MESGDSWSRVSPSQRHVLVDAAKRTPRLLAVPRPKVGCIKRCCDHHPSVRPSVCLSRFLILTRSLDGGIRASPLQTHAIGGSTIDRLCPHTYDTSGESSVKIGAVVAEIFGGICQFLPSVLPSFC